MGAHKKFKQLRRDRARVTTAPAGGGDGGAGSSAVDDAAAAAAADDDDENSAAAAALRSSDAEEMFQVEWLREHLGFLRTLDAKLVRALRARRVCVCGRVCACVWACVRVCVLGA